MRKWDKGVDYEYMYKKILKHLSNEKRDITRCYLAIALIQLRNGLRASESIRAFKHYLKHKQLEFEVLVSKKKKPETRFIVIPRELLNYELVCYDLLESDDKVLTTRYKNWIRKYLKINSHSLRYSFITHAQKLGFPVPIIAQMTKHSKLDFILSYTQEKEAREFLRNM